MNEIESTLLEYDIGVLTLGGKRYGELVSRLAALRAHPDSSQGEPDELGALLRSAFTAGAWERLTEALVASYEVGPALRSRLRRIADMLRADPSSQKREPVGAHPDSSRGERSEPRELLCQMCGRDYPIWSADNDLWNAVMRGGVKGSPDDYDFVCPTCFVLTAASHPHALHLTVGTAHPDSSRGERLEGWYRERSDDGLVYREFQFIADRVDPERCFLAGGHRGTLLLEAPDG